MTFNKEEYWKNREKKKDGSEKSGTITVYICAKCGTRGTTLHRVGELMICLEPCPPMACNKCHLRPAAENFKFCEVCTTFTIGKKEAA